MNRKPIIAKIGWYRGKTGSGDILLCGGPIFNEAGQARVLTFLITGHTPPRTERKLWRTHSWSHFAEIAVYLGEIQEMPSLDGKGRDISKLALECVGRLQHEGRRNNGPDEV